MTTNTRTGLPRRSAWGEAGRAEAGFSLVELLVATALLLMVSSIVTQALLQMTKSQAQIWNRTEMHSGIRGATELLQQEVGQAGRVSLPMAATNGHPIELVLTNALSSPVPSCDAGAPATNAVSIDVKFVEVASPGTTVTSVQGINATTGVYGTVNPMSFLYAANSAWELVTTMDGTNAAETLKISSVDVSNSQITACYTKAHAAGTVLVPMGAFASGVIPDTGVTYPSDGYLLKLFGDVNGDGNTVYIEYKCDVPNGVLTRYVVPYNMTRADKLANAAANTQVLLANITDNKVNPTDTAVPCFTYQEVAMSVQGTPFVFVLNVAVTLTVQSEQIDPITRQKQKETKALLNVSPRNIFAAWELAGIGYTDRIQSTPATIAALIQP
jgi:prepilin-type N-terminal cleavage/methylation domain-containing protein